MDKVSITDNRDYSYFALSLNARHPKPAAYFPFNVARQPVLVCSVLNYKHYVRVLSWAIVSTVR
jgi:hypothetical protein